MTEYIFTFNNLTILVNMETKQSKVNDRIFTPITRYEKDKFINGIKLNLFRTEEEK